MKSGMEGERGTKCPKGAGSVHRMVRKFFVEWNFSGKWVRSQIDQDTLEDAIERCREDLNARADGVTMRVVEVSSSITERIHILPNVQEHQR